MKNKIGSSPKQLEFKFTFGPLLHQQGAETWTPEKMDAVASTLESQAHQLRTVAKILRFRRDQPPPQPRLKWLPQRKCVLN